MQAGRDVYFGFLKATSTTAGKPGAVVRGVQANTPVGAAGLKSADVITGIDGQRMRSADDVSAFFAQISETHDPFEQIPIEVVRGSRALTLDLTLASNAYLGTEVQDAPKGEPGALVHSVPAGGPAAKAGVKADDVITALDGKPVPSADGLVHALGAYAPGDDVELTVSRGSRELTLTATLVPRAGPG